MSEEKKEELKEEEKPQGDVQPEKTQEEINAELEKLREENARLAADNTNYKQAIINKKADNFSLEDEPEVTPEQEYKPVQTTDEDAWKEVDRRAREIAEQTAITQSKTQIKQAEKIAIKTMMAENPELQQNPALLEGVKEYYVNRHGKTVEGLKLDMKDALDLYKLRNNIPLEVKQEEAQKVEEIIPQTPTGGGQTQLSETGKLSSSDKEVMEKYCPGLSEDTFLKYKEQVLSGQRGAPQEVINLFKSGL